MTKGRGAAAVVLLAVSLASRVASAGELRLPLDEAIGRALQRNERLVIERENVAATKAFIDGATGAYDQYLELEGSWQRSKDPTLSLIPSTTSSSIVPENRSRGLSLSIRQLLPTGGALAVRAQGARQTSDATLSPLAPSYGTQVGVELRQPLLRDLAIDAARFSVRSAEADRHGAQASLRRSVTETVAAVERAYWALAAARMAVDVRDQAVALAQEQLQQTRLRVESGSVPRTELAQPQASSSGDGARCSPAARRPRERRTR